MWLYVNFVPKVNHASVRSRLLAAALFLTVDPLAGLAASQTELQYNRDIRPILSENCFRCHGPDKNARKAKLRLDDRAIALEKKAIVPGKPEDSELVRRIFSGDPEEMMPPPESNKKLTPQQKELLKSWIASGAEYQPHWAYITPKRPEIPKVKDPAWVRTPVDAFILAELEKHQIKPSDEADRPTLLRRLNLDLIGLPPHPADIQAFANRRDPRAYEACVEQLLSSPHYGERMAVPWLDAVRFADTVGYHGDQNVNVFPYRDYVIDSFNGNKRFDEFTIEQLAGDLLPRATVETRVATCFNRLNMMTREGGAQPKEYLAKYAADRVRTVATTWLGSTMGCAECHDHKYDPFWTKDFYSMEAFFADIKQWGVYQDYKYTPNPDLKNWSNDHPFPPEIEVESPYLKMRSARLQQRIHELMSDFAVKCESDSVAHKAFSDWRENAARFIAKSPTGWLTPEPDVFALKGTNTFRHTNATVYADGRILFGTRLTNSIVIHMQPGTGPVAALRLELIPDERHGGRILRSGAKSSTIALSLAMKSADSEKERKLGFLQANADHKDPIYSNGAEEPSIQGKWKVDSKDLKSPQTAVYLLEEPLDLKSDDTLILTIRGDAIGSARVSVSPFAAANPLKIADNHFFARTIPHNSGSARQRASIAKPAFGKVDMRKTRASSDVDSHIEIPVNSSELAELFLLSTRYDTNLLAKRMELENELLECRDGHAFTLVTEAWKPAVTRVLPRGNWQNESGEIVQPGVPHFLPQPRAVGDRRLTRLDLAQWLVSRDNPLTARAFVNRLWKQFFGAGICTTLDDFGIQGDAPSHPELLDWLAVEFQESGWDIKHMVRLIVLSSTYRQSSNLRQELRELDPNNRLLASQNPRRLEAEFVRDNALGISDLLNEDLGGPSVHPYQPAGYYANLQFPDRDYVADKDERQYRRGIYTHWQRTFLQPMLANFDAPSREECTANRVVSNTPQQALTLLNDPTFVEASRALAAELLKENAPDESRIDAAFQRALVRDAKAKERASLLDFLASQRAHYAEHPDEVKGLMNVGLFKAPDSIDPKELAAWTSVCRVILNLHETISIY